MNQQLEDKLQNFHLEFESSLGDTQKIKVHYSTDVLEQAEQFYADQSSSNYPGFQVIDTIWPNPEAFDFFEMLNSASCWVNFASDPFDPIDELSDFLRQKGLSQAYSIDRECPNYELITSQLQTFLGQFECDSIRLEGVLIEGKLHGLVQLIFCNQEIPNYFLKGRFRAGMLNGECLFFNRVDWWNLNFRDGVYTGIGLEILLGKTPICSKLIDSAN